MSTSRKTINKILGGVKRWAQRRKEAKGILSVKANKPRSSAASRLREAVVNRIFDAKFRARLKYRFPRLERYRIERKWKANLKKLLKMERSSTNNETTIYTDGAQCWRDMWSEIQNAKQRVWMETYILKPDHIGLTTIRHLTNAANRGCQVVLLYDWWGTMFFPAQYLEPLKRAGGHVIEFHRLIGAWKWPREWRYPLMRNHRKTLVCDANVAFCGGLNTAADYASQLVGGTGKFRDTHVKVIGDAVDHIADVFVSSMQQATQNWEYIVGTQPKPRAKDFVPALTGKGQFVQILASDYLNKKKIQDAFELTVRNATKYCFLTFPYFLPPKRLQDSILAAASNSVDVRILTAGCRSDIPLMAYASTHIYGLFLEKGVRIYELQTHSLHAKTITADGIYGTIGSYNLDPLSYTYLLDINLAVVNSETAHKLEQDFLNDLKNSKEITFANWQNRSWWLRALHWVFYKTFRWIFLVRT